MASFHCAVKSGGGGRGSSHSDYIEREGKYKTGDRDDLEHAETLNLPEWAANSAEFWKQSDALERANASGYREYEIGLPREMTPEQRLAFVREFIATEIGDKNVCTFAIHCPPAALEGGEQPHAHIMFSERTHDGIERKTPEHYFKQYSSKNVERGGCKKLNGVRKTDAERKADLVDLRERFAKLQNKHLEKLGHADRVTHLSLKAQGIERAPEQHLGPKRIQARSPEVVQLMAARSDRTLSELLRRSIVAVERRLARLFKVQDGRAAQAAATPAPTRLRRFGQAANVATQSMSAAPPVPQEAPKAPESVFQPKATQSPQPAPTAPPAAAPAPVAPRKDTAPIGAAVSADDKKVLVQVVAALFPPGTPWQVEPARAGQSYTGAVITCTDTHVFQRGEGFSIVAHDIDKLQNPAAINAQIDSGKIKLGVQLDVIYGQDRGNMQHRAPAPIAKPPPQAAPRQDMKANPATAHAVATMNVKANTAALQKLPGMAGRPQGDIEKLAYWRGLVHESNKGLPTLAETMERFDSKATDPALLRQLEATKEKEKAPDAAPVRRSTSREIER